MQYRWNKTAVAASLLLAATLGACGGDISTDPTLAGVRNTPLGPDSTTNPVIPAHVSLRGRVLGITVVPGTADSLRFSGLPLVPVRLMRNLLVDGKGTQVLAAELTTSRTGEFSIDDIPGGYYVVYADPPAQSGFGKSYSLLAALKPHVQVDVYVSKR